MPHPQIPRAKIEGMDFTLYYVYDQGRDGKLTRLSEDGKIEWFRLRMNFVFLEPLKALYGGKTLAYRALNSTKPDDLPARSFVVPTFSVLLNGIEALGSFLTASTSNEERFYVFVRRYMKPWNGKVPNSPFATTNDLKEILWKHFRNGIAHGFCIEGGAVDNEADSAPGGFKVEGDRVLIGPYTFFRDFLQGVDLFFKHARTKNRKMFLRRFECVYRH